MTGLGSDEHRVESDRGGPSGGGPHPVVAEDVRSTGVGVGPGAPGLPCGWTLWNKTSN